jgi:hypothetical protein
VRRLLATAIASLLGAGALVACSSAKPPPPKPALESAAHLPDGGGTGLPSGASGSSATVSPEETVRETRRIGRMLKRVSAARGLEATRGVPGKVLSREDLIARVKDHVAKEIPPSAIRNEGLVLQLLGFVPPKFDYEAETFALLEAQLAGFYEPADGSMYMAADLDEDNATATLAHELVHSLQDQHYYLGPRSKYKPGQGDKSSAGAALAEGDATSAMIDVMVAGTGNNALDVPEDVFTQQVLQSVSTGPGANAPHAMRASLVAPNIDRTIFINALRRRGGWKEVDLVWRNPPTTTEQVLHLDKYDTHELGIEVAAPTLAALGAGWTAIESDTYGELGARLTFGEWIEPGLAAGAAAHWGGDRAVLVKNGDKYAFAWRLDYDAGTAVNEGLWAERTYPVLTGALEAKVGPAATKDAGKDPFLCITRKELGPLAVMRRGKSLVFLAGPTRTAASGVWGAAGDCALAKKWATEIAGSIK